MWHFCRETTHTAVTASGHFLCSSSHGCLILQGNPFISWTLLTGVCLLCMFFAPCSDWYEADAEENQFVIVMKMSAVWSQVVFLIVHPQFLPAGSFSQLRARLQLVTELRVEYSRLGAAGPPVKTVIRSCDRSKTAQGCPLPSHTLLFILLKFRKSQCWRCQENAFYLQTYLFTNCGWCQLRWVILIMIIFITRILTGSSFSYLNLILDQQNVIATLTFH